MATFKAKFTSDMSATFNANFKDDSAFTANFDTSQQVITGDYNVLYNKPSINDVELIGNKYCEDLGIFNLSNIQIKAIFDRVFGGN